MSISRQELILGRRLKARLWKRLSLTGQDPSDESRSFVEAESWFESWSESGSETEMLKG